MTGAQILQAEARTEGEAKGRADVLLRLLELKFGPIPELTVQRVRSARLEELDRWVERVLSASSMDEVLAG